MSKFLPKGTKKLGIKFGDNDFYYTFTAFLRLLLPDDSFTHHLANDLTFTKAKIVELFNDMGYSLYLLKQNAWRYKTDPVDKERLAKYLKITEDMVYIDDEVTHFMENNPNGWDGEFFGVDFTEAYVWAF